jgi:hypothetical protein
MLISAAEQVARERRSFVTRWQVLGWAYPLSEVAKFFVGQLAEVLLDA